MVKGWKNESYCGSFSVFYVAGNGISIKHRCVTHLYGCNSMQLIVPAIIRHYSFSPFVG